MCTLYGQNHDQTCLDTKKREEEIWCKFLNLSRHVLYPTLKNLRGIEGGGGVYSSSFYSLDSLALSNFCGRLLYIITPTLIPYPESLEQAHFVKASTVTSTIGDASFYRKHLPGRLRFENYLFVWFFHVQRIFRENDSFFWNRVDHFSAISRIVLILKRSKTDFSQTRQIFSENTEIYRNFRHQK